MDDEEKSYIFGSLNDLLSFVKWLVENFEDPQDFEDIILTISADDSLEFEDALDLILRHPSYCTRAQPEEQDFFECSECGAIFATPSGLNIHSAVLHADKELEDEKAKKDDEFWDIINNSYTENQEGINDDLHNSD
jgi:hypothetical protein